MISGLVLIRPQHVTIVQLHEAMRVTELLGNSQGARKHRATRISNIKPKSLARVEAIREQNAISP